MRQRSEGSDPLIAGEPWSRLWPDLAAHLLRVLCRRVPTGTDPAEVVQETAFRILRSSKTFVDADHVAKEATRIAINLATDARRRSRLIALGPMPADLRATEDVEQQVAVAQQWDSLQRQAALMSIDLKALVDPSIDADSRTEAAKSRRYRARKLLREWREAAGAALALPKLRWLLGGATAAATFVASPLLPFPSEVPDRPALSSPADAVPGDVRLTTDAASAADVSAGSSIGPVIAPTASAAPPPPKRPTYRPQIEIRGPAGAGADKGTREYPPDDQPTHVACVRQEASPVPELCLPHPLRQ